MFKNVNRFHKVRGLAGTKDANTYSALPTPAMRKTKNPY